MSAESRSSETPAAGVRHQAILLPGAVLPVELAYAALLEMLAGDHVDVVAKDLEVYASEQPPPGYSLDVEVDGVLRAADAAGFERFHLVGYSGGGATATAFAAGHPDRLRSLALLEPAWIGNDGHSAEEQRFWRDLDRISALPPEQMMSEFVRSQLAAGVDPPAAPAGPPPPWMRKRAAGIQALTAAFKRHQLEADRLRSFNGPVYYALGGLSNPYYHGRMAERASKLFGDFTLEVFDDCHHFHPPHRVEPERLAHSLRELFARRENPVNT